MGEIKYIEVSIRPEYLTKRDLLPISKCTVRVKVDGLPELSYHELIPDTDFQSRFDWFIEKAVKAIKGKLA